mmetsp:Transcript_13228/g.28061  ORF Transcript_13228/g.28061 Transcript_13228/m.28061 type:complete len:247 (-) Transcript_13228:1256-1996(-)
MSMMYSGTSAFFIAGSVESSTPRFSSTACAFRRVCATLDSTSLVSLVTAPKSSISLCVKGKREQCRSASVECRCASGMPGGCGGSFAFFFFFPAPGSGSGPAVSSTSARTAPLSITSKHTASSSRTMRSSSFRCSSISSGVRVFSAAGDANSSLPVSPSELESSSSSSSGSSASDSDSSSVSPSSFSIPSSGCVAAFALCRSFIFDSWSSSDPLKPTGVVIIAMQAATAALATKLSGVSTPMFTSG